MARLIWQLVIHSCDVFAYINSRRDCEVNGLLAGVSLPPSLRAPRVSLAPKIANNYTWKKGSLIFHSHPSWFFSFLNIKVQPWTLNHPRAITFYSLHKLYRNHKGASLNSLKISEMSLTILSYMHVLCRRADLVKKSTFLGIIIFIFFACSLLKAL